MQGLRYKSALAAAGAFTVLAWATPAWAGPNLKWMSPASVTSGTAVAVASIAPCPPIPTAGDTAAVEIFLSFGAAGGSGQVLTPNPDGSWSGDVTFNFSGVTQRRAVISASCVDVTNGGLPYAQYQSHHIPIFD